MEEFGNLKHKIHLGVSIAVFLLAIVFSAQSHQITVTNRCQQLIWVGTHGDNDTPENGGFALRQRQSKTLKIIHDWTSGRIWGRTGCDSTGRNCETGDCGQAQCKGRTVNNSVTLAEFGMDKYGGNDYWDISYVDGFNLPMSIEPVASTVKREEKCRRVNCNFDFNVCPEAWKQKGKRGNLAGCKSACTATNEDRFCCPQEKGYNRTNCPNPSKETNIFKNQCRDAYSYAFDDATSLFACKSVTPDSSSYVVTFCP